MRAAGLTSAARRRGDSIVPARLLLLAVAALSSACTAHKRALVLPPLEKPTVMVLSLRMPGGVGTVGRHAWIVTHLPEEEVWTAWECCSPGSRIKYDPFEPTFGSDPILHGVFQGDDAQKMIDCIPKATERYGDPDYWVWPGPNSNTYVDYVLRECGIHVDLPPTCVGKDFRSLLGASLTSGGTGLQLESPLLGIRVGLTEGIELHVLALTFGIDFWPPALLVPFGEGRLGFDDR
jgi:hypothetical protein